MVGLGPVQRVRRVSYEEPRGELRGPRDALLGEKQCDQNNKRQMIKNSRFCFLSDSFSQGGIS